jgi:hypothetical protein
MRRATMGIEQILPPGVTFSAKKSVKRAIEEMATDQSVKSALQDLWDAIQDSPIALTNEATGKPVTFEQFASIGTSRSVKKIEKLTRRVRKTTKGLAAFVEIGGSLEAIKAEIAAEGNRVAGKNPGSRVRKPRSSRVPER